MTIKTITSLTCLAACFCLARPVLAWNGQGHMVVAQIAYNHLDPAVKAKCDALIALPPPCDSVSHTFVSDSTWADNRCESWTSSQHYIDIPISLDGYPTNGVANDSTNVVTAIRQYTAILQDPTANPTNQATALRYLIHFCGDITQPCHASTGVCTNMPTGDVGGNHFYLNGTWSELHALWDAGGGFLTDGASVSNKAAAVEAAYPYTFSVGSIPDPMTWALESHGIAATVAYVGISSNTTPSVAYTNAAQATTAQRMAIGGQRLAKLLNTIYVTNAPVATSTAFTGPNFSFSWTSVSGRTYRVQWKQDLTATNWTDLTDITASTTSTTFTTNSVTLPQQFFRAIVVN
ncbi:MAG: S1/P1 nuclease [Verrucomicrobiia bacterium]|jgi:hypothetical protein